MNRKKLYMLVESAFMLTMGVALEFISKMFIPELPFGGQITIVSMLPIVLISYRHGIKWGLFSSFVYSLLQIALGLKTVTAAFQPGYFGDSVLLVNAIIMLLLDYIIAYTALGLGGIFRNKIKNAAVSLSLGAVVALALRYTMHILSGYILFSGWAEWFFTQEGFPAWGASLVENVSPNLLGFIYSVVYNGMYMIPEIVLTAIAAVIISKFPRIVSKVN
ncbi:MAG: energy-coupled thiamine transporter ThiT [Clostridia bacterium]|nr:energy-coupled thiamine transporter ThiT [Clostridia bacterium]